MNNKPRFFCDNCGQEVGSDIKTCPYCGRYFASIRCPACGFSGEDRLFINGCPSCGYSANPAAKQKRKKKQKHEKTKSLSAEPLPASVYILTVIALLAAVAFLSYFITR